MAYMWQMSSIAVYITVFLGKWEGRSIPCSHNLACVQMFALKSGRCAKSEYDLRTYYGYVIPKCQLKKLKAWQIQHTTVQWVCNPPGYTHSVPADLPKALFLGILVTIPATFDVGVANTYTPYPGGPCVRPRTTQYLSVRFVKPRLPRCWYRQTNHHTTTTEQHRRTRPPA